MIHDNRKLSEEDYDIEKNVFLQKMARLCSDFLQKTGDNMLSISIESNIRDLVLDTSGNACRGVVMELDAESWYTDPDIDHLKDFEDDDD